MNHWRNQDFIMVASPQLIAEYEEVLSRPSVIKYTGLTRRENTRYIQEVKDRTYMTGGTLILDVTRDPDDNMVLACAEEGLATHLVTGNIKDFPLKEYKGIQIVTPKEFLGLLEHGN